ncbi:MAG TPA: DUF6390 family protein [Patescibacteria group bacterium]|nr:DUF6390 family protein [Patescibacteria group bacterium]
MDKKGLLLCAQYAASPNFFGFCGPSKSSSLIDHLVEKQADGEVSYILSEFETLYPYLRLIARENSIADFFDRKVVEAYWIGNNLLCSVRQQNDSFFDQCLGLERKIERKNFAAFMRKIRLFNYLPHHAFHVMNIFKRTGRNPSVHTIETMDACKIGWGRVIAINADSWAIVATKPLIMKKNKLALGTAMQKNIQFSYGKKQYMKKLLHGSWVSFHWEHVCDILTEKQVKNLAYYTQKAIDFFNNPTKRYEHLRFWQFFG